MGNREFATGLTLLLAVVAVAQDPPQEPEPAQQTTQEQEEKVELASPQDAPPAMPEITLGWADWDLSGNRHKFRQYATPPRDLFLRSLLFEPWYRGLRHGGSILIQSPGEDDSRFDGSARLNFGKTWLEGYTTTNRFFDATPLPVPESKREVSEGYLRQMFGQGLSAAFVARMDQQDNFQEPPADQLRQRTRLWNGSVGGEVAGGFAELGFTNWRYYDRTDVLPDTKLDRWNIGYTKQVSPKLSLEGSFSRSTIKQAGFAENDIEAFSIGGAWQVAERTNLSLDYRNEKLDLPVVQNAYVRERGLARARVIHRWSNWSAQFGYRRLDVERVRADQTFVDAPTWHTFEARVAGRITPNARLTVRGARQGLDGRFRMATDDSRALYWRDRAFVQTKIDLTQDLFGAYFTYTYHENRNDGRDTRVRNHAMTIGGNMQPREDLNLYLEFSNDLWSAKSSDPESANLDAFFPDAGAWVVGANWTIHERAWATLNYTQFTSKNDNPLGLRDGNVKGKFFTAGLHYLFPQGYALDINFAPWDYSDKFSPQMGYDAAMVSLSASLKF